MKKKVIFTVILGLLIAAGIYFVVIEIKDISSQYNYIDFLTENLDLTQWDNLDMYNSAKQVLVLYWIKLSYLIIVELAFGVVTFFVWKKNIIETTWKIESAKDDYLRKKEQQKQDKLQKKSIGLTRK